MGAFFGGIGDGGFTLVCISGCRGVVGFNVATSQMPVREKVRPALSNGGASAKKFARARKMAHNRRFMACWASFFVNTPLEGSRRASFFAG